MGKRLCVALLTITILAVSSGLAAAWTMKRLTNNPGFSGIPAIAGNGTNIYVVWQDKVSGAYKIYFRKSADSGATWQAAKSISSGAIYLQEPAIAASGSNVYAVWSDDPAGNPEIYFRKSADGGATWQAEKRLTNNAGSSNDPAIAADGANIYVVWHDTTPGNAEIHFLRSTDRGATWKNPVRLTNNSGGSFYPAVAADGANLYVVWHDTTPGNREIFSIRSTDGGASWQGAKRLTNTATDSYNPVVAASGTYVYAAWYDSSPGNPEVFFRRSIDNGASWQSAKRLTNNGGESRRPVLAAAAASVYLAWYDYSPGNPEIYFRKSIDRGANWLGSQRLTFNSEDSYCPSIATDDANVYVAWYNEINGTDLDIFVKYEPL